MKIRPVGAEFLYADGRTDRHTDRQTDGQDEKTGITTLRVALFRNLAKATKN